MALGEYPISFAKRRTRRFVFSATRGLSASARETVEWETPAALAMSLIDTPMDLPRALHTCAKKSKKETA
jgi:hypothetical protein